MLLGAKDFNLKKRLAAALAPHPSDNVWLDFIRSLAICLVLVRHGQRIVNSGPDLNILETFMINGWAGVDLFFVLSGYLVTSGIIREFNSNGCVNLASYAERRIRRVAPAYFFVLFLVVIGYFPFFSVSNDNLMMRIGYHILFLQDYFPSDINVVFWSLGVEAKFYAFIPLLILPFIRFKKWPQILVLGLAIAAISPFLRGMIFLNGDVTEYYAFWRALRSPFYACLEPLMFGFLIAILQSRDFLNLDPKKAIILFVVTLILLIVFLIQKEFLATIDFWDAIFQPIILSLLFALLLVAAVNMKEVNLPLKAVFRFGARVSYSLYLVHFPLIPVSYAIALNFSLGQVFFWIIYISISLLHALLILAYIEAPLMKKLKFKGAASNV